MKYIVPVLLLVLFCSHSIQAELVYSNSTTDTLLTLFPTVNGATEVGDQITLDGTARIGQTAAVQYYVLGDGMFDATLRLYDVGSPVGSQIGPDFTVTNITVSHQQIDTIEFALGGITLPDELIFMFAATNVTPGLDVGLNLFEPPTIGNSFNGQILLRNETGFVAVTVPEASNLYFTLDATAVPEPSPWPMVGIGGLGAALWRVGRRWMWGCA